MAHDARPLTAVPAGARQGDAEGLSLTIDELARELGLTVRTIRSHQARGLLPPPEVRQRTGYYGDAHVARLRLIRELQGEGFNLKGIKRLIEQQPGPAEALLDLKRVATEPFETEEPELLTLEELAVRFGEDVDVRVLGYAAKLGMVVPLGSDRYEITSPSLMSAAEEVMRHGVPIGAALHLVQQLQRQSEASSRAFVKLFLEHVLKPFEESGSPEESWGGVADSIERLRPLASEALLTIFQQTMTREVQAAFGKELERRVRRGR